MSRQSPIGFAFSVVLEIVAIVAIVSLLPRFDLRPTSSAAADQLPPMSPDGSVTPVGWTEPARADAAATRPTSFYDRQPPRPIAPPLIEVDTNRQQMDANRPQVDTNRQPLEASRQQVEANRPQYVEQRLDKASQTLVNTLGSAVSDAADNWRRLPRPVAPTAAPRPQMSQQQPQPRPWIRY